MAAKKTLDPLDIAMINLNTIPDTKLSEIIGISPGAICTRRRGGYAYKMTNEERERRTKMERAKQNETAKEATRNHEPYTTEEDDIILYSKKSDMEIAKTLHRTLKAIANRRARLLGKMK